jgi:hypothetical protein
MPVIAIDITRREHYADGVEFGDTGAYERIDASLTFAVDPLHEANDTIVDLDLAWRDADGRVRFTADLTVLSPVDPSRGNRGLLLELPNRGRRGVVGMFNRSGPRPAGSVDIPPGDGFLFRHGFTIASIGWQWDVPQSDALIGLHPPQVSTDEKPVRGQVVVEMRPNATETTRLLANRIHRPYPAADTDEEGAVLLVRDYEDGADTVIERSQWRFAQEVDGRVAPSDRHVYLESGFTPGKIYNVVYTTEGAPVVGAGLLALRDAAAFLREDSPSNPCAGGFERTYGYGISQTGRMLRHFLHLGLNVDERGRKVFDGLLPHVAGGRRGEFNHRFAQPSAQSPPGFGQLFPFANAPASDPFSGERAGLLDRLRERDAVPKVVYTNTSAEYWRGDGSLVHVDPSGDRDLDADPDTRIYHFAGTQHTPGSLPQSRESANEGARGRYGFNTVDYAPLLRAVLINLDNWVTSGTEPPADRHPRIDDETAVDRRAVLRAVAAFPEQALPDPDRLWVIRTIDLGPQAAAGIGRYPVEEGESYPSYVPAVDGDGNEVAGIGLPDITVPVATHLGWNLRDPETGAPEQLMSMSGSTRFFASTRKDREASGDPRGSLEDRYSGRDNYVARVEAAARALVADCYLLEEDIQLVVSNAVALFDAAVGERSRGQA